MFNKYILTVIVFIFLSGGAFSAIAKEPGKTINKYEYLYKTLTHPEKKYSKYPGNVTDDQIETISEEVTRSIESQLNEFGEDGWDLVSFDRHHLKAKVVFKRVKKGGGYEN